MCRLWARRPRKTDVYNLGLSSRTGSVYSIRRISPRSRIGCIRSTLLCRLGCIGPDIWRFRIGLWGCEIRWGIGLWSAFYWHFVMMMSLLCLSECFCLCRIWSRRFWLLQLGCSFAEMKALQKPISFHVITNKSKTVLIVWLYQLGEYFSRLYYSKCKNHEKFLVSKFHLTTLTFFIKNT